MLARTIDPFFRRLFIVTSLVLFILVVYKLTPVIIPFLCAFILAYLFNPLVKQLSCYMRRWIAIILVYLVITLGMGILLWWLVPTVWAQLQSAWDYLPKLVNWYNTDMRNWVDERTTRFDLPPLEAQKLSKTLLAYFNENYNVDDAQSVFKQIMTSGMTFVNNAGLVILVPILTFYFLFNWQDRLDQWKLALPAQYAKKIIEVAKDCDEALMAFVQGQLLVMFLLGAVYAILLELIGLELGLTIGMVAGVASFVPYLGFGIGIIAALISGLFQFGLDWLYLAMIVGAFMIGQAIEGYILQPLLLGDKIGLSPLWVIFAVLAGAALMGFVGMLIALPVSAVLNVLFQHAYAAYTKTDFYKGRKQLKLFD